MSSNKPIVVTGFGLFRSYECNPSWEAVKLLNSSEFEQELIKLEIPVAYNEVEKEVERIWTEYDPLLVVHCGVSCMAKGLTLEKRAVVNIERYCQPDVNQCTPVCVPVSKDDSTLNYVNTSLDVARICDDINQKHQQGELSVPAYVSLNAGEYLCEFIYRCSLSKNPRATLFIHVPHITAELTAQDISSSLGVAIKSAVLQLQGGN